MNSTQYIVVETPAQHEFRVLIEEHPEELLWTLAITTSILVVALIVWFLFKNKN